MSARIREARLPQDAQTFRSFILGSQQYESAIEDDRRLDPAVGDEYLEKLLNDVAKYEGKIFVAESDEGAAVGWAVVLEQDNEVFVVERLRRHGYLSELFVVEAARGRGVGRALIGACEAWARGRGLPHLILTTLSGNTRARAVYETGGFRAYAVTFLKPL